MDELLFNTLESIPLSEVVKEEYKIYQLYTLMDRAIPYLQDGLKPGQRRILYTLWRHQAKGLLKVSSATGLVLNLHPHGPASVESAIVNMAQDYTFANNYPVIDKKGYFGERMETTPAAGRYIECKLGKMAEFLLFDDMNQVEMVPNYDEKTVEPLCFLPKLPMMLLNGAEGIGTGFSSVIPSFHHKDIVDSMINAVESGKPKKLKPFFHNYNTTPEFDSSGKITFNMKFELIGESVFITEIPRNYDSARVYKHLGKFIDSGFIKDYIDSSVDNEIKIELLFKRGLQPPLEEIEKTMGCNTSLVPNYTLISERGVRIFNNAEEIIAWFTTKRLEVVKRRYELLCKEYEEKINQSNEIIRFIKKKYYIEATKVKNRKTFVEYLESHKFTFSEYLADMPIYRMTKDEVEKRVLMVKDDSANLKQFEKISKSKKLVEKKLIEELLDTRERLNDWLKQKESEHAKLQKELAKKDKEILKKQRAKKIQ